MQQWKKLLQLKVPSLVVGAGGNRKLTSNMLTEFVDSTGIPFVSTQLGKGVIDERHPLFMGCAALSASDYVHRAVEAADLIINVGHDVIEKPPFFMAHGTARDHESSHSSDDDPVLVSESTQVIHVSFSPAEVDPVYFPQLEVIGDIANAIWQIKKRFGGEK
jgi:acetolactate synthase-1/2/3 large subunit